ncbi:hypothetical protein YPPY102_2189, partial [Yersinia pestis PY-102]
MIQVIE